MKCSSDLPKCAGCTKANVECVSIDPVTGREVPRSYVVSLESRVEELESRLRSLEGTTPAETSDSAYSNRSNSFIDSVQNSTAASGSKAPPSFMGASSGIPFSKLMVTALNLRGPDSASHKVHTSNQSIMDPSVLKKTAARSSIALLPPKQQALSLLSVYFAQSNAQLPIFHREEFLARYFQPIYGDVPLDVSFASTYTSINPQFFKSHREEDTWYHQYTQILDQEVEKNKNADLVQVANSIDVPAQFHVPLFFMNMVFAISSSVTLLKYPDHISDNFKNAAMLYIDSVYGSHDRLEALQGILCFALYSLMRPAVPGVWYILGSALRVCVDLGLHFEGDYKFDAFTLDLRRRLFWCCYSLDRQVCFYLGRPFGIPEESCSVPFPSELDDAFITRNAAVADFSAKSSTMPTYKLVSLSMFRIRRLQSEVQSILYDKRELPRRFASLDDWHADITRRLDQWKADTPKSPRKMNCDFIHEFFILNYSHTKVILNGLSPRSFSLTLENYMNVLEASKDIIYSYHELYQSQVINYTWAATHNLFMAGSSFLYAIFNCEEAKQRISVEELQTAAMYCSIVLSGLSGKCEAAVQCRDIFDLLTAAVIRIRYANFVDPVAVNLPSTEQIKQFQPGNHVNEHLRDLVSSLPATMRSMEGSPGFAAAPSKPYEPATNESELTTFFEELNKLESMPSSRSPSDIHSPAKAARLGLSGESPLQLKSPSDMAYDQNVDRKLSKEGQKIYKMIFQVPTESIWEQFFANPGADQ
ncbi:hypothetical protein KL933_000083 [Ogataea haglerorum]|uniref:Xylanolytic transcriptional activator regulatory domain-containing protein n=1 Tax=Ogataea haglerorum TaxID=1937702 RepID=A0AAN6D8Y4_9ASCO|nr:hypothetical protein KL913_000683 [Ogataea haglerorum]KAG7723037.1 hypothetical protein KL949_000087 [Ogataea haglerorum]KAG7730288.1 hypothetical protein KL933_000083 [Ogataea haglerorum]KAG7772342.1 hypothetical protein KL931_000682 [Ogataea haglerorum]KAG7785906.1 hypothetical protein KL945_003685 [Ogataea haglerorum]